MARTVQLACSRCGHSQMHVVDSAESGGPDVEIVCASDGGEMTDDAAALAATRLRRLESLPTSLPVGGIITPV